MSEQVTPNHRVLKAAVIIMGVLLVVGMLVILITITLRLANLGDEEIAPMAPSGAVAYQKSLPAGAQIQSVNLGEGAIAIQLSTDAGSAVWVFDAKTGSLNGVFSAPK
jgi:hypothetical protein